MAIDLGIQIVSGLVPWPVGPAVSFAYNYAYSRRHLMFNSSTQPLQALTTRGASMAVLPHTQLDLTTMLGVSAPAASITLHPSLASSVQQLGLRSGDPVTLIFHGRQFGRVAGGLIVPTTIGKTTPMILPRDDYAVVAFGVPRRELFDALPAAAVGGGRISPGQRANELGQRANELLLQLPRLGASTDPALARWQGPSLGARIGFRCNVCEQIIEHAPECPRSFIPWYSRWVSAAIDW